MISNPRVFNGGYCPSPSSNQFPPPSSLHSNGNNGNFQQPKSPHPSQQQYNISSPSYGKSPLHNSNGYQTIPHSPVDTPPHSPYHQSSNNQNNNIISNSQNNISNIMGFSPGNSPYYSKTPTRSTLPSPSSYNVSSSPSYSGSSYNLQDLLDDDDDDDDDPLKKKRKRTSPDQLKILEKIFMSHQHPNLSLRNQLAIDLQMTPRSVQIWFQNRRAKARNMEFKPNLSGSPIPSDLIYNISTIDKISNSKPPINNNLMQSPHHQSPHHQSPHHQSPHHSQNQQHQFSQPQSPYHQPSSSSSHQQQSPFHGNHPHQIQLQQHQPMSSHSPHHYSQQQAQAIQQQNLHHHPYLKKSPMPTTILAESEKNGISIGSIWHRILTNPRNIEFLNYNSNSDDPNTIDVNARDNKGLSLLFTASVLGYEFQVRRLVECGANPNIRDNQGNTPLIAAALLGNQPILEFLLKHHADPNQCNDDGVSPLFAACKSGHLSIVKLLLENHSEVSLKLISTGETPIHIACLKGFDKIVQILLDNDAKPNLYDNNNYTPLHHASILGYFNIVKLLISKGANKDATDKEGHTPLHNAALLGNDLILDYLLKNGTQIDTKDNDGFTALHYAVRESRLETVKILFKYNASVDQVTKSSQQNILHLATQFASVMMAQLIFDRNFPIQMINDVDSNGNTPLLLAMSASKTNFVKYLLTKGASPKITLEILNNNNNNNSVEIQDKELINLLLDSLNGSKADQKDKEKEHKISEILNDNEININSSNSNSSPTSNSNDEEDDYYTRTLYKNSTPNRIISNSFIYQQQNTSPTNSINNNNNNNKTNSD